MASTGETTDAPPELDAAGGGATPRWSWMLAAVLVAVPVVRMIVLVAGAHPLPYNDYWPMMDSLLTGSGGFDVSGLFELRNEHPLVVAKLLYWLNLKATGGSNIALGMVVVVLVLGQLAIVGVLARDLQQRWRWAPPVLVVTAAVLLFSRQGSWHFLKSMSGAAWLSANLFALLAIWAQTRRREGLAVVLAVVTTLSYGTGLAVWPVLAVVALLTGARVRNVVGLLAGGVAAIVWLQLRVAEVSTVPNERPAPRDWARRSVEVVGGFLVPGRPSIDIRLGALIVAAGAAGALALALRARRRPSVGVEAAPWVGIFALGVAMAVLVAGGRDDGFYFFASTGRYAACGALTCLGVAGIGLALLPTRWGGVRLVRAGVVVGAAAISLWVLQGGGREVERLDGLHAYQDQVAIALETRLLAGSRLALGQLEVLDAPRIEDRLDAAGQSFFVDDEMDCGLLSSTVERSELRPRLPDGVSASATFGDRPDPAVPGGLRFDGWLEGAELRCAVVVGPGGEVVGASGHGPARKGYGGSDATDVPGRTWFSGVGRAIDDPAVYVRLRDRDGLFEVPLAG